MNVQPPSTPLRLPTDNSALHDGTQPNKSSDSCFIVSEKPTLTIDTLDKLEFPVPSTPDVKASDSTGTTKQGCRTPGSSGIKSYAAALSSGRKTAKSLVSLFDVSTTTTGMDSPGFGSNAVPPSPKNPSTEEVMGPDGDEPANSPSMETDATEDPPAIKVSDGKADTETAPASTDNDQVASDGVTGAPDTSSDKSPGSGNKNDTTASIELSKPTVEVASLENKSPEIPFVGKGSNSNPTSPLDTNPSGDLECGKEDKIKFNVDAIVFTPQSVESDDRTVQTGNLSLITPEGGCFKQEDQWRNEESSQVVRGVIVTATAVIADEDVGLVIGRFGHVIREIQSKTGTCISIPSQASPGQTNRFATIKGFQEGCSKAQQMIERIIQDRSAQSVMAAATPPRKIAGGHDSGWASDGTAQFPFECQKMVPLPAAAEGRNDFSLSRYRESALRVAPPGIPPRQGETGYGTCGTRQPYMDTWGFNDKAFDTNYPYLETKKSPNQESAGAVVALEVLIPDKNIGMCIGKAGYVIREMQNMSGTHIQISRQKIPGATHRVATVIGPQAGCEQVQRMIDRIIEDKSTENVVPYHTSSPKESGHASTSPHIGSGTPSDEQLSTGASTLGSNASTQFSTPLYEQVFNNARLTGTPSGRRGPARAPNTSSGGWTSTLDQTFDRTVHYPPSGIPLQFRKVSRNISSFTRPQVPEHIDSTPVNDPDIDVVPEALSMNRFRGRSSIAVSSGSPFLANATIPCESPAISSLSGFSSPGSGSSISQPWTPASGYMVPPPGWTPPASQASHFNAIAQVPLRSILSPLPGSNTPFGSLGLYHPSPCMQGLSSPPPTYGVSGISFPDPEGWFRGERTLFALGLGDCANQEDEVQEVPDPIANLLDDILQEIKDTDAHVGNVVDTQLKDTGEDKINTDVHVDSPKSQDETTNELGKAQELLESLHVASTQATELLKAIPEDEPLSSFASRPTKQRVQPKFEKTAARSKATRHKQSPRSSKRARQASRSKQQSAL